MSRCLDGLLPFSPAGQGGRNTGEASRGCRRAAGSSEFLSCSDGRMPPFDTDAQFLLPVI